MTARIGSPAAVSGHAPPSDDGHNGWTLLAPLPDRVGFGGMFAGVLNGRLVAGGGSQFPEKPLWLKGEKTFSDRIFTLAAPNAKWVEHATRLPAPVGSAACAAPAEVILFAGGLNASNCLRQAWEVRAKGDDFSFTALPELPHAIGYATAAVVGRRFYVVGGLDAPASKTPSVEVWSLDLDWIAAVEVEQLDPKPLEDVRTSEARPVPNQRLEVKPFHLGQADAKSNSVAAWRREPDLPGPGVFVAAAAAEGRHLYVFGGIGFDAAGKPVPAKGAYRLDTVTQKWERLADLPEARVGISSPCPVVAGNKIFLIGGYAEVFPGAPREHPGFSAQTLYYDLTAQRWENGPVLPVTPVVDRDRPGDAGPAPMIGAPCVVWQDHVVVVGGEVRSSVRTPAVLARPLRSNSSS